MRRTNIWTACCLAVALASCSQDTVVGDGTPDKGNSVVTFSLTGLSPAQTRATADGDPVEAGTAASDNEKAVSTVHVVVFKDQTYLTTATATLEDGMWKADLTQSGAFDLYFVANASSDLVTAFGSCTTKASLFSTIATQAPGDNSDSNPFLMTSDQYTRATDNTSGGTDIGTIDLTRAAARIDVKVADVIQSNLKITGITMKNRYVRTYFAQAAGQEALATADASAKGSTAYTDGFGTDGVTTYEQMIYAYENIIDGDEAAGTTVLTVEGKMDGVAISHDIEFTNVPLKRNYHYVVTIEPADTPDHWSKLAATIEVKDWTTGEQLVLTNAKLTDRTETPSFTVACTGATIESSADPVTVMLADNAAATLTVTVTTTKATLAKVVCTDQQEGFTVTPGTPSADADGNVTQDFTIALMANTSTEADRVFTFAVENQLKKTLQKTFTVTQPKLVTP